LRTKAVCYDGGMTMNRLRQGFAQLLLAVAYLSLVLQWLWICVVGLPPLVKSGRLDFLSSPPPPAQVVTESSVPLNPFTLILIGIVTFALLVVTVIILVRIPQTIAKTGEQLVQHTSQIVLPVVTHHKKLPEKKRRLLSRRIRLMIQIVVSLIPVIIGLSLPGFEELSKTIVMTIALFLGLISLISFSVSWLVEPTAATTSRTRSHASRG
jgi:hypothetical protein